MLDSSNPSGGQDQIFILLNCRFCKKKQKQNTPHRGTGQIDNSSEHLRSAQCLCRFPVGPQAWPCSCNPKVSRSPSSLSRQYHLKTGSALGAQVPAPSRHELVADGSPALAVPGRKCPKPGLSLAIRRSPRPPPCQNELREERKGKESSGASRFPWPHPEPGLCPTHQPAGRAAGDGHP